MSVEPPMSERMKEIHSSYLKNGQVSKCMYFSLIILLALHNSSFQKLHATCQILIHCLMDIYINIYVYII